MMKRKIGFIGLGNIGKQIALHLVECGFDLTVFDIKVEPLEELKKLGAKVATHAKELAQGTDVIISYDPKVVEIPQVRPGLLYQKYPVNEVDTAGGKIGFSAIATPPKPFSGKGTLAYLKLKVLKAGTVTLSIEFVKGETTDSNVVQAGSGGKDVLDKVINAYYSVKD